LTGSALGVCLNRASADATSRFKVSLDVCSPKLSAAAEIVTVTALVLGVLALWLLADGLAADVLVGKMLVLA
jgi:hypothetical protein